MSRETYDRKCPECCDFVITDLAKGPCHLCLRRAGKEKYPKLPKACRHPKAEVFIAGPVESARVAFQWCFDCGALRINKGRWRKPTGVKR